MRNIVPSNQTPTRRELTRSEESNLRMQLKSLLVIQNNDDKYEVKILLDAVIDKVRSGDKSVDKIKKEVRTNCIHILLLVYFFAYTVSHIVKN